MSPIDWAKLPLQRYADFEGRSPRSEYWWFCLFQMLAWTALIILVFVGIGMSNLGPGGAPGTMFWVALGLCVLLGLGLFLPNLAVQVRRLHDQDLSGWFILLFFIPYIGGIIAIVFMCIKGTIGPNRFGPDPFEEQHLETVFA